MSEILISVNGVYKKYCRNLRRSMIYGLRDISADILNLSTDTTSLRTDEFWVLNDVSFDVKKGEVLGLLGANGAGKSTMLKLISGLVYPDVGDITTKGKVGELIEIGAGFHPLLTGRENIYIKGAILGMSKNDIDQMFDEIVGFAELESFIDTSVKYYSSGMHMRLGFSVIVHSRPDILLIDEMLAVGDVNFRAKCFNKLSEVLSETAVVFISHSMGDISRICNKVLVLDHGKVAFYGNNIVEGIDCYYRECSPVNSLSIAGSGKASITDISISTASPDGAMAVYDPQNELILDMTIAVAREIAEVEVTVTITNLEQQNIVSANSFFDGVGLPNRLEGLSLRVNMGHVFLKPGVYSITIGVHRKNRGEVLARYGNCLAFRVSSSRVGYSVIQPPAMWVIRT